MMIPSTKTDVTTAHATTDAAIAAIYAAAPRIVSRAASTTPQTAQTAYFTVTGRVKIVNIVGEVTVELGAGANNFELFSNPSVGADVALCTALDTDADVVGTVYGITGTITDAMLAITSGAMTAQQNQLLVTAGTIDLKTSASKAGQTKWTVIYIPLDAGSSVVAA